MTTTPNTPSLCRLAAENQWSQPALAHAIAATAPSPADWQRAIARTATIAAAMAFGMAMVFFIAYNWSSMGRFAKLGLLQGVLAAAVAVGIWRRNQPAQRHAAMVVTYLSLGALLALVGQTYQTGADPWQLFAAWAGLGIAFVFAGSHGFLWALWLATVNLALVLFFSLETRHGARLDSWPLPVTCLVSLNGAAFALALAAGRHLAASKVAYVVAASFLLTVSTLFAVVTIIASPADRLVASPLVTPTYWALYVLSAALVFWWGWQKHRSLVLLALVAISIFAVGNTAFMRLVVQIGDGWLAMNIMAVAVIASAAGLAYAVRRAARSIETPATEAA